MRGGKKPHQPLLVHWVSNVGTRQMPVGMARALAARRPAAHTLPNMHIGVQRPVAGPLAAQRHAYELERRCYPSKEELVLPCLLAGVKQQRAGTACISRARRSERNQQRVVRSSGAVRWAVQQRHERRCNGTRHEPLKRC